MKRRNHMFVLTDGGKTFKKYSTFFMNETQQGLEGTYFKSVKTIYEDNKN